MVIWVLKKVYGKQDQILSTVYSVEQAEKIVANYNKNDFWADYAYRVIEED